MSAVTAPTTPPSEAGASREGLFRCLVPLLDALGWRGDHGQLAVALPEQPEAMELVDFLNTMAHLKFEGHEEKVRLDRLDERALPCLYLGPAQPPRVLLRGAGDGFLAFDGDTGRFALVERGREQGAALFFRPVAGEALALLASQPQWFAKLLGRFRRLLVQATFLSLALSLLALLSPMLVTWIYGQMTVASSALTFLFWGFGVAIYLVASTGLQLLRAHLMGYTGVRLGNIVGNEVIRRLLYLPPSYTETASLGAQLARIRDFETVRDFFSGPAIYALMDMPFTLVLMVGMVLIGGVVAYVPFTAILLFIGFGLAANHLARQANSAVSQAGSAKQEFTLEMLTSLAAIRHAGGLPRWTKRYRDLSAEAAVSSYDSAMASAFISTVSYVLSSAAGIATVAVGVHNVMAGNMSMGALMGCMFLVWRILAPLRTGFVVMTQVDRIRKSVAQLNRFMTMPLECKPETASRLSRGISGAVSLSQVSIRYTADAFPALLGVDLEVEKGECVVVVGHDGAGKSTILKLILGLYVPQAGRVLVDNMNVRQMDPLVLRRSIAYVPQATQLFHISVADNLRLADPAATDEQLREACRRAGVLEALTSQVEGLGTVMDAAAQARLGQDLCRRLCLARMFLRRSSLILLDEPERGLASATVLVAELQRMKGTATMIIVTQSPALFGLADKMVWLDRGHVRRFGAAAAVSADYLEQAAQ